MLGLLDRDPNALAAGDPLPLGWHWLFFHEPRRASALAADGHAERGGFMPNVDLPRRMWAGGTLRSIRPVLLGEPAQLRSEVRDVKEKRGKSGRLVFVTVGQTLLQDGRKCVVEEQVIVYRGAGSVRLGQGGWSAESDQSDQSDNWERAQEPHQAEQPHPAPEPNQPAESGQTAGSDRARAGPPAWTETFLPTTVTLFQFSALTWNAHRIHYDHPYVTEREGYPDLLVHGPLTALLLLDAVSRHAAAPLSSFRYRALAPLYVNQPITLVGRPGAPPFPGDVAEPSRGDAGAAPHDPAVDERIVEALGPDGTIAMRARVR